MQTSHQSQINRILEELEQKENKGSVKNKDLKVMILDVNEELSIDNTNKAIEMLLCLVEKNLNVLMNDDLEEAIETAHNEGFDEGYNEGYEIGILDGELDEYQRKNKENEDE